MLETEHELTGYPSIDKPWLKYYSEEAASIKIPHTTMYQYALEMNADNMDGIAFHYYGNAITFRKLFKSVEKTVYVLNELGIRKGDIFTVMSMQTPECIALIYAASYMGAIANMVYPSLSESEIRDVITNTESRALFVLDVFWEKIANANCKCPIISLAVTDSFKYPLKMVAGIGKKKIPGIQDMASLYKKVTANKVEMAIDGNATSVIVYTSGTTGKPKGVELSGYCLNAVAQQLRYSGKNYRKGENCLFILPPFLGFGIGMLHLSVSMGLDSTLWLDLEPHKVAKEFNRLKPSRFVGGPVLTDAIMQAVKGNLSNLVDFTGGGGEILHDKEVEFNDFLKNHGSNSIYAQGYGMTEFASVISANQNHIHKYGSIGIPLPLVNIKIVNPDTGDELSYDSVGELWVQAPNTMNGYFRMPDETADVFRKDEYGRKWLLTGDLCEIDANGFIYLRGRIKRIFLIKDETSVFKLFPQRVEELLGNDKDVVLCACVAVEDSERLNIPKVYVQLRENIDSDVTLKRLNERATEQLPSYYIPIILEAIETMPITKSGKIDYQTLLGKSS